MAFQYQILANQIAKKIRSGEIQPNQKLNSLRIFSKNHNISMTTAKACYELLESQGLIFVKYKSGYFVRTNQEQIRNKSVFQFILNSYHIQEK
ncbi:hypothetical protein P256_02573 [Acinetobacter nectaris CIP 110549]|uniref:HTH gntR-type domain-containing protein n=1 Tax=Acinetobacter nectaris CIP 110549 TaxID=1392540 RepID=V2TFN4_9GAMM|nr:hypothetical protein P256_02573 [Acinetobacter nectaris CIP 110549]